MTEQSKLGPGQGAPPETGQEGNLPDEDRRRILGKLATGAFVVPLVLLVLDGGKSVTYGY